MSDTSSPKVVPALTKTDARELKSLVKNDTAILMEELDHRRTGFARELDAQLEEALESINEARRNRDDEDAKTAARVLSKIQGRITNLNKAIVEAMTELGEAGWTSPHARRYGRTAEGLNPHEWTVALPNVSGLRPPSRDDSDLDEQRKAITAKHEAVFEALTEEYRVARRDLAAQEASINRDLVLQSITTEAAKEFVLNMPTVENLLPAPESLVAIES